jgi:FkbM family methyltransferase
MIRALLPPTVSVQGARVHLNPNDPVVSGALVMRVYERPELAFFKSMFRPDMTLIDVGANVGLYTAIAASSPCFSGSVLAIEPDEESYGFLLRTISANVLRGAESRIRSVRAAAVERECTLTLYKNSQNRGDNRLYRDPMLDGSVTVKGNSLDNLCLLNGVSSAHFIKIDVQGAEARVLAGAGRLIKDSPDCIWMSEFWPYGLKRAGATPQAYLQGLADAGFRLYELCGTALNAVSSFAELVDRYAGRRYGTVIGLKGRTYPGECS